MPYSNRNAKMLDAVCLHLSPFPMCTYSHAWNWNLWILTYHLDGLMQDCSNSIANALELLQSCTKPSISTFNFTTVWGMLDTTADIALWSWFLLLTCGGIGENYVIYDWGSDVITLDRTGGDCIALSSVSSSQSDLDGNRGNLLDLSWTCDAVVAPHSACCCPVLCTQPWWYWHFVCCGCGSNTCIHLTHWGQDKMVAILWTAFSTHFSRM